MDSNLFITKKNHKQPNSKIHKKNNKYMNYINKLQIKRAILLQEIEQKEHNIKNQYNAILNHNNKNIIETITNKLTLITTISEILKTCITDLNSFLNKK